MMRVETAHSPLQKQAITFFDRDLYVSAGAGSGKTSVLVERFLYAATHRKTDPERILAITFTEKAAAEMKSRLVEECRKRGLKDFRRKLESAYISTIHGFCSRVLKENPIESGVDPFFKVLSAGEAEILMDQVIERIFTEDGENNHLTGILGQLGEEVVCRSIKKFYAMNRALGSDRGIFRRRDLMAVQKKVTGEIFRGAEHLKRSVPERAALESERQLRMAAQDISRLASSKNNPGWMLVDRISEARALLHKRIPRYKEEVDRLRVLLDEWVSLLIEEMGGSFKKEFERICMKCLAVYDEEKRSRASYDFEDLLFMAYRLLSGTSPEKKAVQVRYQAYFDSILVDEYQDTNPLQDKIIDCLKKKNNLFIVGDVQQSIYGFRYAEPELFEQKISGTREGPRARQIRLNENYRSREEILRFINGLFQKLPLDSVFHPLEARRSFALPEKPVIEVLCVPRAEEELEELDGARVWEARSLAAYVCSLIGSGFQIHAKENVRRPVEYRDIAVLFRGMTRSYLYEKEFVDASIPYSVTKGGGFYEKPEILDLLNCLKVIDDPHADIALAGVLRSPLVGVTDDALFWLASHAKGLDRGTPLAKGLQSLGLIGELTEADRKKLNRFNEWIEGLRRSKSALKISQVLEKILRETCYEAKVLVRPDGKQKAANLFKLVSIAESVEENDIAGIQDFVHYMERLLDSDVFEAEAPLGTASGNAVTFSTIHAAKGLEFPVVILADMGRKKTEGRKEAFISLPEIGLGLKLRNPKTQEFLKDYTFHEVDRHLSRREAREEERLLYVALTRAKESLVLSGSLGIDPKTGCFKKNDSWMSRLVEALGWEPFNNNNGGVLFHGLPIGRIPLRSRGVKEKRSSWSWAADPIAGKAIQELRVLTEKENTSLPIAREKATIDFKARLEPPVRDYEETGDHSVTELLLAAKRDFGSSDTFAVEVEKESLAEDEKGLTPRNEYGTLFHRLMEHCVPHRGKKITASHLPLSLLRTLQPEERREMKQSVLKFWSGVWGRRLREARICFTELPFIYKTPHGILKGQMDLVAQLKTGEWLILDYKTNRITPSEKDSTAQEYELQLLLYAFVFQRLYGDTPKRGVLYFSAIQEAYEFPYTFSQLDAFEKDLNDYFQKTRVLAK